MAVASSALGDRILLSSSSSSLPLLLALSFIFGLSIAVSLPMSLTAALCAHACFVCTPMPYPYKQWPLHPPFSYCMSYLQPVVSRPPAVTVLAGAMNSVSAAPTKTHTLLGSMRHGMVKHVPSQHLLACACKHTTAC